MSKLEFLKKVYGFLKNPNIESLNLSMADTHHNGLFSLVINGNEFGRLTRVFISDVELLPYEVQLHTHRYPIKLTVIKGLLKQHIAELEPHDYEGSINISMFNYKSPLNGGKGLSYVEEVNALLTEFYLPIGATINMGTNEFHTISCNKGSIWIVEEKGFELDSSRVLGVPFITEGLYNPPSPFQVNDKCQLVAKEIKKLILDYEVV